MKALRLLPLLIAATAASALAHEIPDFDSNAHCDRFAGGPRGDAAVRRCLWVEEYALSELETFWPSTSAAIRAACIDQTEEQSYTELAKCVLRLRRRR